MIKVERWDSRRDGKLTEEAMRKKLQREGFNLSRYEYPPGTVFPDHTHLVDKKDAVLSGRFRIIIEAEEVILVPGDCVSFPAVRS